MSFKNNQRRADERNLCREALAAHIYERLGIIVPPSEVRLQPSPKACYAWSVLDEDKKYLLRTPLANGHVGIYKSIRQAIGTSIEAVHPQTLHATKIDHVTAPNEEQQRRSVERIGGSFTATIQQLEQKNAELTEALEKANIDSKDLATKNDKWEEKVRGLDEQLSECKMSISRLEDELNRIRDGILKAMGYLEKCHSPGMCQEGS